MLPKIGPGILGSVNHEINDTWIIDTFKRIKDHDPVMGHLLAETARRLGLDALGKSLLVYRLLESQFEVNEMESL